MMGKERLEKFISLESNNQSCRMPKITPKEYDMECFKLDLEQFKDLPSLRIIFKAMIRL